MHFKHDLSKTIFSVTQLSEQRINTAIDSQMTGFYLINTAWKKHQRATPRNRPTKNFNE